MNTSKDYYAILGVLPSAEDIVIRAAYKALAQRYHPDRFSGSPEDASKKMADLNEAYDVLSDSVERARYDEIRGNHGAFTDDDSETTFADIDQEVRSDWQIACEYFPDLLEIYSNLGKVAHRLATTYQLFILNTKRFSEREELAQKMEEIFLESYFGKDRTILRFAKTLITQRNKSALKELNRAVTVLGFGVDGNIIIKKIVSDFSVKRAPLRADYTDQELKTAALAWNHFRRAVYKGDVTEIKDLVNLHPALLVLQDDGTGNSALHIAVLEHQPESIRTLLELGADPQMINHYQFDAISFAQDPKFKIEYNVFMDYGFS